MNKLTSIFISFLLVIGFTTSSYSRDQIKIVGSSTVYPYATVVAEKFGKSGKFKTPVIESTGTGGGMKLFCAGVGVNHPDVTNASRAIKPKEKALFTVFSWPKAFKKLFSEIWKKLCHTSHSSIAWRKQVLDSQILTP